MRARKGSPPRTRREGRRRRCGGAPRAVAGSSGRGGAANAAWGGPELRRGRRPRHPSEEVGAPRFTRSSEPFVARITGPRIRLEDLRAPGQRAPGEQRIRLHDSALAELLQTECLPELRERDAAEIGRAE